MAFAHHDTSLRNQRSGCETDFISPQNSGDNDIAPCFHLTVRLNANPATQIVHDKRLLGFGQTDFPGRTGMLDRRQWRCPCSPVMTGNHNMIGLGLGDTGRNGTDPDFGNQLDRNSGTWIDVFQIMNQLRQIFNGIDIVMRRRRDQTDPRNGKTHAGNILGNLSSRQLPSFTRLGALCHLDLDFIRGIQIFGRHAEPAGSHLLDFRTQGIPFLQFDIGNDPVLS